MLSDSNTIVITTTLSNSVVSEKRRTNFVNEFAKYNLSMIFNHGIKKKEGDKISSIMFSIFKNSVEIFLRTNFEYGLICDDDFIPCPNFLEELNNTAKLLPEKWRCLHLCPGYLWGRMFRDNTKKFMLNPEYDMTGVPYHESGRFYNECNRNLYLSRAFWLGGPIAILVNKKTVVNFLVDFINQYMACPSNNDVILTAILNKNDYICREPMLGYENEEGGSTFQSSS